MKYYTERALSNRGKCKVCRNRIEKDEIKLIFEERGQFYPIKKTFCRKCGLEELKNVSANLKIIIGELE